MDPELSRQYGEAVAERLHKPEHAGSPQDISGWFRGMAGRPESGAVVVIWLRPDERGELAAARFEVFGDPAIIAAADWLCDYAVAHGVDALAGLAGRRIGEALALPAARMGGALLVEDAARAALHACRAYS